MHCFLLIFAVSAATSWPDTSSHPFGQHPSRRHGQDHDQAQRAQEGQDGQGWLQEGQAGRHGSCGRDKSQGQARCPGSATRGHTEQDPRRLHAAGSRSPTWVPLDGPLLQLRPEPGVCVEALPPLQVCGLRAAMDPEHQRWRDDVAMVSHVSTTARSMQRPCFLFRRPPPDECQSPAATCKEKKHAVQVSQSVHA